MNRFLLYLIVAVVLTGLNRFEEVRFVTQGKASLQSAFYGARIGMTACVLAAAAALWLVTQRRAAARQSISAFLRWSELPKLPLLVFLPLAFNNWSVSNWLASPGTTVEITSGWGGSLANTYFVVAVLTAMFVEPALRYARQGR